MATLDLNWAQRDTHPLALDRDQVPGGLSGNGQFGGLCYARPATEPNLIMAGRNTGGGAAVVYWFAPQPDPTGNYYAQSTTDTSVAFGSLTDIRVLGQIEPYHVA